MRERHTSGSWRKWCVWRGIGHVYVDQRLTRLDFVKVMVDLHSFSLIFCVCKVWKGLSTACTAKKKMLSTSHKKFSKTIKMVLIELRTSTKSERNILNHLKSSLSSRDCKCNYPLSMFHWVRWDLMPKFWKGPLKGDDFKKEMIWSTLLERRWPPLLRSARKHWAHELPLPELPQAPGWFAEGLVSFWEISWVAGQRFVCLQVLPFPLGQRAVVLKPQRFIIFMTLCSS